MGQGTADKGDFSLKRSRNLRTNALSARGQESKRLFIKHNRNLVYPVESFVNATRSRRE
jgi:hypothetical protein